MKTKTLNQISPLLARPVAIYARVSSEEQTKGSYPSCESQVEELVAACQSRGWEVKQIIKDEGFSAGSLKRPGMSELRSLVESKQINAILCTWYDRLTRSRDFYVLDSEFRKHGVQFVTLHDPTDTKTAAGRFMESMLVAAKTYEREQTSEKVRSKMRMRAEKGMWNGGPIPFGFQPVDGARTIMPDPEKTAILNEMFRVYNETQTDYKVRDYLHAHQVPTRTGESRWTVSSVRGVLTNRRYVAQIEINRANKDLKDLPETETYQLVKAPYEPPVPLDVFELAQAIRKQKGAESPNRVGKPRGFSQTQCNRVFPLQGVMVCGHCGHAMTPWYIKHQAGGNNNGRVRKNDSFVFYYVCALQRKGWRICDHKNCVSARKAEKWVLERIQDLMQSEVVLQAAVAKARQRTETDLSPVQELWAENQKALVLNQSQADEIVKAITSGNVGGALWQILNEKSSQLQLERDRLRSEERRLREQLTPLSENFDASGIESLLRDFTSLVRHAQPEEVQRLLRLVVRRIEWKSEGSHKVQFYHLPRQRSVKTKCPPTQGADGHRFYTDGCNDRPCRIRTYDPRIKSPLLYQLS